MANIISDETIEYVGILAKLELNEEEKEQAKKDMESMLDYIDKLNELDTDNVAHFAHLGGMIFGFILIMYWRKKNRGNGYYYN